jgi:hypothetical protein
MLKETLFIAIGALLLAAPALAGQAWQKPVVKECRLEPGAQCNVEVTCPKTHPVAVSGGGGIPKSAPPWVPPRLRSPASYCADGS